MSDVVDIYLWLRWFKWKIAVACSAGNLTLNNSHIHRFNLKNMIEISFDLIAKRIIYYILCWALGFPKGHIICFIHKAFHFLVMLQKVINIYYSQKVREFLIFNLKTVYLFIFIVETYLSILYNTHIVHTHTRIFMFAFSGLITIFVQFGSLDKIGSNVNI